jgi:hypothetical protein
LFSTIAIACTLVLGAGPSPAESSSTGEEVPTRTDEATSTLPPAADGERTDELVPAAPEGPAPPPATVDGQVQKPKPKGRWRLVPRAIFFVPRYALDIALHPLRLGLMAFDKYAIAARAEDVFFNDERTFGMWPSLFIETGFGANGGVHLLHRNLFGHGERLRLRAGWGGMDRQIYSASVDSGNLLGDRARISLGGTFRISPSLLFFGIGDRPLTDAPVLDPGERVEPPIDPFDGPAITTRYRRDLALGALRVRLALTDNTVFEFGHTLKWARYGSPSSGLQSTPAIYDTTELAGFHRHPLDAYIETAIVYDDLRTTAPLVSTAAPSTGWRLRTYGGFTEGLRNSPSHYGAAGLDVQRYIDLWAGNRVLVLRVQADHVIGRRDRIPFADYPTIGGPQYLRGYLRDRFRDRFTTLASVEYMYPIFARASGFLFVDAGRVWENIAAVRPKVPHFGFGGGIQIHTPTTYVMRLQLAGSQEGFFINYHFNPTSKVRDRLSP